MSQLFVHCLLVVGGAVGTAGEGADSLGSYHKQCTCTHTHVLYIRTRI